MNIIAIRKSGKTGKPDLYILDTFDELSHAQVEEHIRQGNIPAQLKKNYKSGKYYVSSLPNSNSSDNFSKLTVTCNAGDFLLFDGYYLNLKAQNGRLKARWNAVSGSPGSSPKNQAMADYGPLPEGRYTARFDCTIDIQSSKNLWDTIKWLLKSPSWGLIVTPLEPDPKTNTYGRSDFYIHGGFFPGSKGCIDLTSGNRAFHTLLRLYKRNVTVVVLYSN